MMKKTEIKEFDFLETDLLYRTAAENNIKLFKRQLLQSCKIGFFDIDIAKQFKNVNLSIMIEFLKSEIFNLKKQGINCFENSTWVRFSFTDFSKCLPIYTPNQVKNFLNKLVSLNILKKRNFNTEHMDQTLWYAFVDEARWGI